MDIRNKIQQLCEETCGKQITPEEKLLAMMDSYKLMDLICSLEDEFQITFLPKEIADLDHFSCMNSIVELVKSKYDPEEPK